MDTILKDIRYGFRSLLKRPGFAAVAIVTLALGIGANSDAFALMKIIANLLFGVTSKDSVTFAAVAILLAVVALVACYIPAYRAARLDPLPALRYE